METLRALGLAVLSLFASQLFADSISVTFTGTGGYVQGNAYTAPYYLAVGGSGDPAQGIGAGNITVICDDYTHDVTLGPPASQWIAQINDFNSAGLAASRFSSMANSTTLYEEAAWLTMQTGLYSGTQQTAGTIGEINYAIWKLFDPSLSFDATAQGWITNAQKNAPTDNMSYYSNVRILTPIAHPDGTPWTDSTSPQEYLTVVAAPEPGSFLLLATGMGGLVLRLRRKSRLA
jgi:hypothetical protein